MRKLHTNQKSGYLLIFVMIFSAVLFTIISSFITFIIVQSKVVTNRIQFEQAGQIAEAGLNYYKWFLAHYPNDITNGTGLPGPYIGIYKDPEGAPLGEYSLTIASTTYCGEVVSLALESTGHTYENPVIERTVKANYARPTIADYAFILNSSVWAGPDRIITGPYHSNGGVRMDGHNDSVVTSQQTTWVCNSSFGCNPAGTKDGVFTTTANANPALFKFPTTPVNFAGITVDLDQLKQRALTGGGKYFKPISNGSNKFGYEVHFNADGTVTVRRVKGTVKYWGYSTENHWQKERNIKKSTQLIETFTPPADCPVLFFEDKVWLSGEVRGKVTLVAGNLIDPNISNSIILADSITYSTAEPSGLLAIAQQDILIGVDVPNDMYINGIYIAQNGHYGRNFYCNNNAYCLNKYLLPGVYQEYTFRANEYMNGTIVSNGRVGTQWTNGGETVSGFLNRYNTYDRNLVTEPPPFVPVTSDVYRFSDWQDQN